MEVNEYMYIHLHLCGSVLFAGLWWCRYHMQVGDAKKMHSIFNSLSEKVVDNTHFIKENVE